jgi:gamma-glutamylcyclotransferase (GGCT)/AIG2-like uncharacterized protein YtfP
MDNKLFYVFVYGTLKSVVDKNGIVYSEHLKDIDGSCTYLGPVRTKEKFSLHVSKARFNIQVPFMHDDEKLYEVYGELYLVSEYTLQNLDMLERGYQRKKLTVIKGDKEYEAYAYFNNRKGALLKVGYFVNKL